MTEKHDVVTCGDGTAGCNVGAGAAQQHSLFYNDTSPSQPTTASPSAATLSTNSTKFLSTYKSRKAIRVGTASKMFAPLVLAGALLLSQVQAEAIRLPLGIRKVRLHTKL